MTSQSALELLQTRRTVTAAFLGGPGPDKAQMDTILTVAMRVPDHGKLAPWRFISMDIATRKALAPKLQALREAMDPPVEPEKLAKELEIFVTAPACLIVVSTAKNHPKIPVWEQHLSVGASAMNMIHAAHALGFGAQWLTGWATYHADAKALFGVESHEDIAGFMHIGTPTVPPVERPRPNVADHLTILNADKD